MRRFVLTVLLLALSIPAFGQGGPELDALLEAFFAKDLSTVVKHLPPELAQAILEAPPRTQNALAERFLLARTLERDEHVKFTQPESGPVLVVEPNNPVEGQSNNRVEIYLDKRMMDSNETMLRFRLEMLRDADWGPRKVATFYLRYVEGEWRLYEMEADNHSVQLDDPKFIEQIARIESQLLGANEASAVSAMRTLNTAMVVYASTYPDIGFASTIDALAGSGDSSDHAGLIDNVLGTSPYEKSGYRFTLTVRGGLPVSGYEITARPVRFGETGSRSFFTDESGVIRCTLENREPVVNDPPLQ